MFGQLQLAASAPQPAVMVPDTAIVTDGARRVGYVIGAKGVVQARPVTLGPVIGGLRGVRKGLTAKDRVGVGGIQSAAPGQAAKVGSEKRSGGKEWGSKGRTWGWAVHY